MRLLAVVFLVAASLAPIAAQEVYRPGNGVSLPTPIKQVKAGYTEEAKQRQIEGEVVLDVVVDSQGAVTDVKVARSLDDMWGLDKQAVAAARQWTFKPGMKDGKPVAVRVMLQMRFTLK